MKAALNWLTYAEERKEDIDFSILLGREREVTRRIDTKGTPYKLRA